MTARQMEQRIERLERLALLQRDVIGRRGTCNEKQKIYELLEEIEDDLK